MNNTDSILGASPRRFQMPLCQKTVTTELSNDFILPEYLGEIRKILRISANVSPAAKYVGGTTAEFNGNIEYTLLYVGSDGELYSASLPADYAFNVPLEITGEFDMSEGVTLFVSTADESITTRVSSPRKLNVKCRLSSKVDGYGIYVAEERSSGDAAPSSIVRLEGSCEVSDAVSALCDSFDQSDELDSPYGDIRVISAAASPRVTEILPRENSLFLKGNTLLSLIVANENGGSAESITRDLPFEEELDVEGISADSLCRAICHVSNLSVNVEENKITADIEIIPEIAAYTKRSLDYIKDIYSTENSTECAYRSISIPKVTSLKSGNFSQSERIPLGDTVIPTGSRLVSFTCTPNAEKTEFEKGKLCIFGQCRYSVITEKDGEYIAAELPLPFRYELAGDLSETAENDTKIFVSSARARVDGGNLAVDTELCIDIRQTESICAEFLSEVRYGEPSHTKTGDMIICFPAKDDTAWSVSKRYQVPLCAVSGVSSPTASLETTPYIIINS